MKFNVYKFGMVCVALGMNIITTLNYFDWISVLLTVCCLIYTSLHLHDYQVNKKGLYE